MNICIISHNGYGAIKGGESGHAGGVEFQTSLLAKWLAKRGHNVSFITWDEGGPKEEIIEGIRIIKLCRADQGIPGIRFFFPRWRSLIRALRKADAEIYYHNIGEYVTGQIAIWCRSTKRKFAYYVANDEECAKKPLVKGRSHDRLLFVLGLKMAHLVLVQTMYQQRMLEENFGINAIVQYMPCTFSVNALELIPGFHERNKEVLWVGRICTQKRPELLYEIANALPDITFIIIGKPNPGDHYGEKLVGRIKDISNVNYLGMLPHSQLPNYYKSARVLLNTSSYEGFPNTFLEAWAFGTPVVSTFDPDNLIKDRGLGYTAIRVNEIVQHIRSLIGYRDEWERSSQNARSYYLENHFPPMALPRFEENLGKLVIS